MPVCRRLLGVLVVALAGLVLVACGGLGQFDDQMTSRLGVTALDAEGNSVAVWAGRIDPNAMHVTE